MNMKLLNILETVYYDHLLYRDPHRRHALTRWALRLVDAAYGKLPEDGF